MCKLQKNQNKAKNKTLVATRLVHLRPATDIAWVEVPLFEVQKELGASSSQERRMGRARWEWRAQGVDICEI